jgi:hypothetical protein
MSAQVNEVLKQNRWAIAEHACDWARTARRVYGTVPRGMSPRR